MTVGWARFCAHADTKPRGQTINLSAHPTLFSENKFTLGGGGDRGQEGQGYTNQGLSSRSNNTVNKVNLFYEPKTGRSATESTEEHRENKCLHSLVTLTCLVRGTIAPTC